MGCGYRANSISYVMISTFVPTVLSKQSIANQSIFTAFSFHDVRLQGCLTET